MMCVIDGDGKLVWWNPAFADLLGLDAKGIAAGRVSDFIHPADFSATMDTIPSLLAGEDLFGFVNRIRSSDGAWRWIEWTARSDPDGYVYAAGRDVTVPRDTEVALRDSETRFYTILEHATMSVAVKDLDSRYVFANKAWMQLHGIDDPASFIGSTAEEVWGEHASIVVAEDREVMDSGNPSSIDETVETLNGTREFLVQRFLLRDSHNLPTGICTIATDITERQHAEAELAERERLLAAVVRASPDIVTILDANGIVRQVSDASYRLLGHDVGDVSSSSLKDNVHPEDLDHVVTAFMDLVRARTPNLDVRYRVRHSKGHWVVLDSRGQPLLDDDGKVSGAVVVSRDITAALAIEDQLRDAVEVAERASTAKSEFLSRMSHELRTPLNSVLGFAQLLELDDLVAGQRDAVAYILRAGRHLLDLIDEVLDIARIETGHLDLSLEPVCVADVLTEAVELTRPIAVAAGVQLDVVEIEAADNLFVRADRQRLMQVLLNLLSNATKYNQPGGRVVLLHSQTVGGSIRMAVSDTGPGIDPLLHDRVFEPFDRLGAERTSIEGSGVGLALSRHLVEQMGGSVGFESAPGEGACFWLDLPAARRPSGLGSYGVQRAAKPTGTPGALVADAPAHAPLRILYIEDNLTNHALVEQILVRRGPVDLLAAIHGGLGLELAQRHNPDIILLDLHLPDMTGQDVLDRLLVNPLTACIPVMILSADASPGQAERLVQRGAAGYLTKPIDVRQLLALIDSLESSSGK